LLPITTGNAAFNHQGMVLLMERCIPERQRLIDYLRNPAILDVEEICEGLNAQRVDLLRRKHHAGLDPSDQQRLDDLSEKIRELMGRVGIDQQRTLEDLVVEVRRIVEAEERRRPDRQP
jgi:hypothetical protein